MLQHAVALLLQRLLGKFVTFDSSMLRLSLWQGDLSFQDLQLRLSYGEGVIGQLSVKIPWRSLWTQAVVIKAQGIRIFLHQTPKETPTTVNGLVADVDDMGSIDEDTGDDRTYLSRLVSHILANVQIEISDLQIRYDCMPTSLAKRPGSATLEVGYMSLINTNADWELEFTPQSNAGMESRKLLRTEDVSAYIEFEDRSSTDSDSPGRMNRKYLFHQWYSTAKASLYYHSSNASFPDVDLNIDIGSKFEDFGSKCRLCELYSSGDQQIVGLPHNQPRIHFDADHIDVLYAILIEVKAPYDEYDRLSELTQRQKSRPDGFLMVLTYAKQWLLSDCLDGIAGDTLLLPGDDDDDDDDEFEDAITPPTLSIRAVLLHGVNLFFFSRDNKDKGYMSKNRQWMWILGETSGSIKQSCVEDEIHIVIESLRMYEAKESGQPLSIFDHTDLTSVHTDRVSTESPFVQISCIIPAYQSRIVGHQPEVDIQVCQRSIFSLADETLVMWMTLFAPVYLWWNQWNLSHPSKLVAIEEDNRIAPISKTSVRLEGLCFLFSVHERFCFVAELDGSSTATTTTVDNHVKSDFRIADFRLFSSHQELHILQKTMLLHLPKDYREIIMVKGGSLSIMSHSRTTWSIDSYTCKHDYTNESGSMRRSDATDEIAMFNFDVNLPVVQVDWSVEELEALCWLLGKWSYFLSDKTSDLNPHVVGERRTSRIMCQRRWSVKVPELRFSIGDDRADATWRGRFVLSIKDFDWMIRVCSMTHFQTLTSSLVLLEHDGNVIMQIAGHQRLNTPALRFVSQTQRFYSAVASDNIKSDEALVIPWLSQSTETSIYLETVSGNLFLPDVEAALGWVGLCYDRYHVGCVTSVSFGYDQATFQANLEKLHSRSSQTASQQKLRRADENVLNITLVHGCQLCILHRDQSPGETSENPTEIGRIGASSCSIQARSSGLLMIGGIEVKGSVRDLQVTDLTNPRAIPPGYTSMPNRLAVGSNQVAIERSAEIGSFGQKSVIDFVIQHSGYSDLMQENESRIGKTGEYIIRVRLDSVCVVYLHRIYKQFHHFITDHVLSTLINPVDINPTVEKVLHILETFEVDIAEFPVSMDEVLRMYNDTIPNDTSDESSLKQHFEVPVHYEIVANDITFALPRNSFSSDSIILHCTNARMWSAGMDPSISEFLQNGNLGDEVRLSHSDALSEATVAKAQQSRRMELRNLRRLIKNQRSRMLSNRSQLFSDLRIATQQAQNYLHEGFEALPAAEAAVKIIHNKIVVLDQQLDQLAQYLKQVEDDIEVAKTEREALNTGGRDSMVFLSSTPTARVSMLSEVQSQSLAKIKEALANMSHHLMTPLFVAEDAEFHDARTMVEANALSSLQPDQGDMSTSSMGLFEFELVDLSGATSNSSAPLFHHALLTGRIDSELESLSETSLSSYLGINLSVNELSVGATVEQYTTFLGMIFENFKEVSYIVDEDTYPHCTSCGGHHYETQFCDAIWLQIPVKIADAALRVSSIDHPIADLFWEQLELAFVLRTDDSLEIKASALAFTAIDVRPESCPTSSELLRPLGGDGLQIQYSQRTDWTGSTYDLKVNNSNWLVIYPAIHELVAYFVKPVFDNFFDYGVGFMSPAPPDWKKMEFRVTSSGCSFSLLEDFTKVDSRALVVLTDMSVAYAACQKCEEMLDMKKCHFAFDQKGIYFSQLPDLQIDASFPLSNAFLLVVDHIVEGSTVQTRRNAFVLAPVETRFSVQDGYLFVNIVNNYLRWISTTNMNWRASKLQSPPTSLNTVQASSASTLSSQTYAVDKLLGDVGELRLVVVNNSLGIPIADFQMRDIACEYIQDEDCSITVGGTLSFNYFNNSIYRWEPLVEPFGVQVRVHRELDESNRVEIFAILSNTVNFNITPSMAPLLSAEALKQADFVTTGSKSTSPFWIQNKTGMEIKFSFRRGKGNIIQQVVADDEKVSVDCREQGDMRSFDSKLADRFIRQSDRHALTVNHTLSVWLKGNKWVSANPVVVDVVGHVSVPLREVQSAQTAHLDLDDNDASVDEDLTPPILVAEISIQADGSKLISLHSQVVLQNRTSVPLMVWAFSPRDGGCVREWIVDREQVCHVPLELIHPQSKISIRPSPYVQYAPLATSLEELGDEARLVKSVNSKRFIRAGNCVCNFETFATLEELQNAAKALTATSALSKALPLSGYVARDLPAWKCTYDVEAYYLMRATYSSIDEVQSTDDTSAGLPQVDEEENEKVENDFLNVFSDGIERRRLNHPLSEVNHELDEARNATLRRGLYEATNSSLYHLSVSPFLTFHNRLATAVAYRLLNGSLQLIAEGILAVGNVLPLFQVDSNEILYISFRLENYNWSVPKVIINPKHNAYSVPYKELIEPVELLGRVFDRDVAWEQGNVPNLQLQVKLSGRDVIVFCSVWIVNHSDLDLEYCNSTSSSSKRLESVLKYVHRRPAADEDQNARFSARTLSFHDDGTREAALTRLHKVKAAVNPVALIVVIQEARELYNAQYFGSQSPYVRVSLYVLKNPQDRYLDKPEMIAIAVATTKPSPSGGVNPKWDASLQNTLLLRFHNDLKTLEMARVIIEVRNVRYGIDTCLGVTAVKLETILKDRKCAASFNWYKLLKRKTSRERKTSQSNQASVHRGDISISFSVGTSQELESELDSAMSLDELVDGHRSPSFYDEERLSVASPQGIEAMDLDDAITLENDTPSALPSLRSMQRLQTPGSSFLPLGNGEIVSGSVPVSMRTRQAYPLTDLDSTRSHQDTLSYDPSSTRAIGAKAMNGNMSPTRLHTGKLRPMQVYLPQNRFTCVIVEVNSKFLMSDIFELVCIKCGFQGVLDIDDFDFYELVLPRFVSLRSAGRPEGDRWYGQRIPMDFRLERRGRQYGLHLCHKMTMTTIRLYDESSTASSHHATPRSLLTSSKRTNPAQNRPMSWGEVLGYGSGGKNWDVLRVKSNSSPWSEVIRLNRNAMGNTGVAQVISLTNEVYDQDEGSELRKGNQEIALWSCYGTGRFSETIMVTIVPRYILINRTGEAIKYRQVNVPQTFRLEANDLVPFHWPSATKEKLLEVTLLHRYTWSGSFRLNSIGTTYLKLRDSDEPSRIYILQCQIEMVGGSIALIFREESKRFPPYRIDNMTSFRIQYKQVHWGDDKDFDELPPRSSCPYSWDHLYGGEKSSSSSSSYQDPAFSGSSSSSSRSLQVRFMRVTSSTSRGGDSQKDAVETREYNLDEMASHKRIQLQLSLPSGLFLKPDYKGYLLKKDNLLKWNKKYFRLFEHMLYYFASENDQELLGVVDLRSGTDIPGAGGVAIFEKNAETSSKGGFMSLNGFVSSISGTIFGSSSRQLGTDDDDGDNDEDDSDERARNLLQIAVSMTTSNLLSEESERFIERIVENGESLNTGLTQTGFYVNGHVLVDFLMSELNLVSKTHAFTTAQEMLNLGILKQLHVASEVGDSGKSQPVSSFQCSKMVWYGVHSIALGDDTDSMDSEEDTPRERDLIKVKRGNRPKKTGGSTQFSIITANKCYDLKAKNPKIAKSWVKRLRIAARAAQATNEGEESEDFNNGQKNYRTQREHFQIVQNAKTYVHVRIRADGPTKVLELFEGGEEDFDEKESKHELSSAASASSGSPTASETSTNAFDSLKNGVSIHVHLDGFGISCVNELPMELVYIYLGGINIHYSRINSKMRLNVTLDDVQIDNQSGDATFSKLLCPRAQRDIPVITERKQSIIDIDEEFAAMPGNRTRAGTESDETMRLVANDHLFRCADCKYRQANMASMHFCCTWSNEQGSTDYFEHCSFWLYPVITQLDEELLVSARAFLNAVMQSQGQHSTQNRGGESYMKSIPIEIMTEALAEYEENTKSEELDPLKSLGSFTATSSSENRKVYFALLHIHPVEFDITFRSDVFQTKASMLIRESAMGGSSRVLGDDMRRAASTPAFSDFNRPNGSEDGQKSAVAWAIPSLSMHIPDLDNAPVRLGALMIEHAFGTSGDLTRRVSKYYTRQLWKQLHKILGSFDFLGNPVGFLDHIGTGVRDFVYEPLEGLKVGGKGFSKGLAKGTASLVSNTLDGTFDAASKISGTFGQGLATMSLDDNYQQIRARARRRHVRGIREGLVQGSKELSLGVYEGVTGLVLNPMRGAQENGAVGFVKGTITGIIGLPVKPVAGIFDFASRATQGVSNRALHSGQDMRRVRRPRVFGRYNELKCYKEADTIAYDLLKKTGGPKLSGEKIIFYNEIIQSVLASELTKEAREKKKSDTCRERTNSLRRSLQEQLDKEAEEREIGKRKLVYEVIFHQKKLGLDLETDFYCENVTVKSVDESAYHHITVQTKLEPGQQVLQEGDCLISVGGVDVSGIGFPETLALLRGTARPIKLMFESANEHVHVPKIYDQEHDSAISIPDQDSRLKVQLIHWLIVTEQRVLYINVGSSTKPIVEWMTPLRYIYRVEWIKGLRICLHLSVGVDSLPTGPRLRPSFKALDNHERDMNVFLDVMWHSFGNATAEEQELWPSDTSLNGYLMKKGGFTTVKRWFVLSRNCLYYFSSRKDLRGIIPLGNVRLEADSGDELCIRITNAIRNQPLITLQVDNGQVVERVQSEIVLVAAGRQDFEMWQSSLAHAAGKGLRHSRGTRFFVPTAASRLEVGCKDTPDIVVAPLAEALKKTVEVFNVKVT